jgi:hypothetical protein
MLRPQLGRRCPVTEYQIVMVRSPGLTEAERERRLREAFDVLFNWAEKRTAALEQVDGQDQDSGGTPDLQRVGSTTRSIVDER